MSLPPEKSPSFLSDEERDLSRRAFLRFMGAGAMLAGMSLPSCRKMERYLVPSNEGPEWNVPGLPVHYATCMPTAGNPVPMVAVCRDGRPVKLEPSPRFLPSAGLDACTQASILGLYDPARSRSVLFHGQPANPDEWEGAFRAWAKKTVSGGKVGFIIGEDDSPVRTKLLEDIQRRNPNARVFFHEPVSRFPVREALSSALIPGARQAVRWEKVQRVLAVDCDFLGTDSLGNAREFMNLRLPEGRNYGMSKSVGKTLNRLYTAEGRFSLTGGAADHRLSLHPCDVPAFLIELARQTARRTGSPSLPPLPSLPGKLTPETLRWISVCAEDLCSHPGQSLVVLGSSWPQELHRLVLSINSALKAPGVCLHLLEGKPPVGKPIAELPESIRRGEIETLFLLGESNPVIDAPASIPMREILGAPGLESIHLGLYINESAKACTWHIPAAHYLESWGIERNDEGVYLYRQPVMPALYQSFSELEILSGLLGTKGIVTASNTAPLTPSPAYHHVRKCFEQAVSPSDKKAGWDEALRRGYSPETAFPPINALPLPPGEDCMREIERLAGMRTTGQEISIQCVPDYSSFDGKFAANAWLQECPDPVTGLSWDAPAQCSLATAQDLSGGNAEDTGILNIAIPGQQSLQFVLCIVPGMPDDLIVLPLGYGTENPLFSGSNELNACAYALGRGGSPVPFSIARNRISLVKNHPHTAAWQKPLHAVHGKETPWRGELVGPQKAASLIHLPASSDPSNQWGMSIDLNLCTGCNACMVACQAENNIPVVGREQLIRGRMMHWMRIDRYLVSSENGTSLIPHPVACQQCGKAPCESVCPVNATVHTSDGLNAMAYARCWGTRYCAANCPYKARRFNFFDYARTSDKATRIHPNPSVTVRSRGVMEKCTYCVQRIQQAKARHKAAIMASSSDLPLGDTLTDEELGLPEGAVKTACQLACPAGAIRFGNMLHSKSVVAAAKLSPRTFSFIHEAGTLPRTSYLKRVGNPNPEMRVSPGEQA